MTKRTKVIEVLDDYFKKKGRVLTSQEYTREDDTPIRFQQIRQMFGTWGRMEKILMARRIAAAPTNDADKILAAHNAEQLKKEQAAKAASEDLEAKVAREQAAQAEALKVAEAAATPETANEFKLAAAKEAEKKTVAKPVSTPAKK